MVPQPTHRPQAGANVTRPNQRSRFAATGLIDADHVPPLLEIAYAYPLHTVPSRDVNTYVPDSQMMFHVLGLCDQLMVSTARFTQGCPPWLPVVSQLYTSILWITHILKVQVNAGYGFHFRALLDDLFALQLDQCMIPGPLVPFFQSVTAVHGPHPWIGDITPILPPYVHLWEPNQQSIGENFSHQVPFPALMLDQLFLFATAQADDPEESLYQTFKWYNNTFALDFGKSPRSYYLGPQMCCSPYVSQRKFDAARRFWSQHIRTYARTDLSRGSLPLDSYHKFLGLKTQRGAPQTSWFSQVSQAMQVYCQYFSESTALASISTTGTGASAVFGKPIADNAVSGWLHPNDDHLIGFPSTRTTPLRAMPDELVMCFQHSHHGIDERAETYAIVSHTNIDWAGIRRGAPHRVDIQQRRLNRSGGYWDRDPHRFSGPVSLANQYNQCIVSVYHRQ
ncbi:unnamed protein product [Cuscuta campestris]|uniref:Uncharacterized protein n=1 Tax=Cuscuta campestris TaxID=132261 RepID=A0A484N3L4_9ASTE|nr:unnamed protein product [Cuscuta campestris]